MGAFVSGYWPGITDDQRDSFPGFWNDCVAWGEWMAERCEHPDVLQTMKNLGVDALLSHITEGMDKEEVDWVTPNDLMDAAGRLRALVLGQDPRVQRVVETYSIRANCVGPVHQELAQDLMDIQSIARVAEDAGVPKMTLEVNW